MHSDIVRVLALLANRVGACDILGMAKRGQADNEKRRKRLPVFVSFIVAALLLAATLPRSHGQPANAMAAPGFYIAASGEYSRYSPTLTLKGASNLPPGSRLTVFLYDFIGYKSSTLSQEAIIVVPESGLFEVTLKPREGQAFKPNMVCDISFIPHGVPQDAAVLKITGKNGESLGIGTNPQIGKNSGGYYLQALIHIP